LLSARQIAPGESGQIEVKVHTEGLSGSLAKNVAVSSNDPRRPEVALSIMAVIEAEYLLSERAIFFGSVPKGRQVLREVTLMIPPEKNMRIVSAQSTDSSVSVRLEPVPGSKERKVRVVAIQKPDAKEGYHFGTIVVRTTSPTNPEIKIPVSGIISAPVNR